MPALNEVERLPMKKIKMGPNSRADEHEDSSGLMESMQQLGQLEPIGVRTEGNHYVVIYGFRRFIAASKLGWPTVSAVVHKDLSEQEADAMNLAENVQRRNVSLPEVGRYVELLRKNGMGVREVAIKLGVSVNYIETALKAYQEVPVDYRPHIEFRSGEKAKGGVAAPGKISVRQAHSIVSVSKKFKLTALQTEKLFHAAKVEGPNLKVENMDKYAENVVAGADDIFDGVTKYKRLPFPGLVPIEEYTRLRAKYVDEGIYKNMREVVSAILSGQINEQIVEISGSKG